ncbi:MAG: pyridoxal phosphate-dependent aminotransferase family protein [Thermoguttaceae bacterium]
MPLLESPPDAVVRIDGREYLYFAGTSYLALQGRPEVIHAACEAAEQFGIGSANSRTAFGTTPPLRWMERAAAATFDAEAAFCFASGWMGSHILTQSRNVDRIVALVDEHSHFSVFEAARAIGRPPVVFRHADPDELRTKIQKHLKPGQCPAVLSDGVFAATGDLAPVDRYVEVLREYPDSTLLLDDAHGLGVLGPHGRGTFEYFEIAADGVNTARPPLPCPALLCCGTLSKAVGGYGGVIVGDDPFVEQLRAGSSYTAGASPPATPIAAATARALELIAAEPGLRERLLANARRLKVGLRKLGFSVSDSPAPIAGLTIGTAENMRRIQRELMGRGIAVAYMAQYAGLGSEGALRLAVFATHTDAMIDRLLEELQRAAA